MRWSNRLESVMVIAEKRVGKSVFACYASPVSSDTLTARQRSWLSGVCKFMKLGSRLKADFDITG
jgi:hypothetical protein